MQIGVVYPQNELGGDPAAIGAIGRATEDLGYDYLLMFDHVLGASREGRGGFAPYSEEDPFHDPLVAFGYLAAVTERIGLATGILVLPQRQTALVARQAADVDLLSGGRLRLGVAAGWNPVEYEALGQDFRSRGKRLDEQIPLLRKLWDEPLVEFAGQFDQIDRAALNPRPTRRIPIWCGGLSDAALERASRLADGFIFSGPFDDRIVPAWRTLQRLLAYNAQAANAFGAEYLISQAMSVQESLDQVRRWQDMGGTHIGIRTMGLGFTETDQHIEYAGEVAARLE
jgi:probable F420-dependent oxidoreductase